MPDIADKVTRFSPELVESAALVGAQELRSARQQLEHWARIGRSVCSQQTVARRRVEAALSGRLPLSDLSEEEGAVFDAEISAALDEALATGNHAEDRAAQGRVTVALDENGRLVTVHPDGTRTVRE